MNPITADPDSTDVDRPQPGRRPHGFAYYARRALKAISSLQLTVGLFATSILLVFFGTVAQVDLGIWTVVDKYFWSWAVWVPFDVFNKFGQVFFDLPKGTHWGGAFPFPAGKLLGGAMLLNLLAAHIVRFRLTWKRAGVLLAHSGLVLLFVGEFVTREYAVEQRMTIDEGNTVGFTEDTRSVELAFTDTSDPALDRVTVIPEAVLRHADQRISHPDLPVDVRVDRYMVNSGLEKATAGQSNPATTGLGKAWVAVDRPEVSGVDPNQKVDIPAAYVTLYKKGTDEALGTYLVSLQMYRIPGGVEEVRAGDKTYEMVMRFKRYPKPYRIRLNKFTFARYPGTDKPKDYASDITLWDEQGGERDQTIRMNEPLRHAGETFYQSSFNEETEKGTVLQVVKNPGWLIPYISCALVAFGLITHFGTYLTQFLLRQRRGAVTADAAGPPARPAGGAFPWVILALMGVYLLSVFGRMNPPTTPYNLAEFARIPVLEGGRVKPLETVARVYLRLISHRETVVDDKGDVQPAIRWFLDTLAAKGQDDQSPAWRYKVIRIENDQVLAEMQLEAREGLRYSVDELKPRMAQLAEKSAAADAKKRAGKKIDLFETKMLELANRVQLMININRFKGHDGHGSKLLLLPPQAGGAAWQSLGEFREAAYRDAILATMLAARAKLPAPAARLDRLSPEEERKVVRALFGVDPERLRPEQRAGAVKAAAEALAVDPRDVPEEDRRAWLLGTLELVPAAAREELGDLLERDTAARLAADPVATAWEKIVAAYRAKQPDEFNALVETYRDAYLHHLSGKDLAKVRLETTYDRFAPFYHCTGLYVIVFVLGVLGFVMSAAEKPGWGRALRRSATLTLYLTLVVHTAALLTRMYLSDRPLVFVTNLYSSAIFIGWGCVAIGLVLEWLYPIGIGNVVAAVLGLVTTIVSHNLAAGDDTLEMMQAVLDTNFWLSTHVTTVTLGYTATFVAGFLGVTYVWMLLCRVVRDSYTAAGRVTTGDLTVFSLAASGLVAVPLMLCVPALGAAADYERIPEAVFYLLTFGLVAAGVVYAMALVFLRTAADGVDAHGVPVPGVVPGIARPVAGMALTPDVAKILGQMIYGVVCFATLLSFVGTVLGGIWADQSWGRFWGWDPKENGAVLIVLWNALILHARWVGLVKHRGVAVLAVGGNIITAWSWFGTNQLGIGLHAYGFDNRLAAGCRWFWLSQLAIIGLGLVPQRYWASVLRRGPAPRGGPDASPVAAVIDPSGKKPGKRR